VTVLQIHLKAGVDDISLFLLLRYLALSRAVERVVAEVVSEEFALHHLVRHGQIRGPQNVRYCFFPCFAFINPLLLFLAMLLFAPLLLFGQQFYFFVVCRNEVDTDVFGGKVVVLAGHFSE
jgi:hypothetical protein